LHDHPWWSISVLLLGAYREVVPANAALPSGETVVHVRVTGDVAWRRAAAAHRIQLLHSAGVPRREKTCWTLFITGPHIREWGFHCPKGWVHWRTFTNPLDGGRTIGRGCA